MERVKEIVLNSGSKRLHIRLKISFFGALVQIKVTDADYMDENHHIWLNFPDNPEGIPNYVELYMSQFFRILEKLQILFSQPELIKFNGEGFYDFDLGNLYSNIGVIKKDNKHFLYLEYFPSIKSDDIMKEFRIEIDQKVLMNWYETLLSFNASA